MNTETRILRDRQAALSTALDRAQSDRPPFGSAAVLCQTFEEDTYPVTAASMFACKPQEIDSDESEGATASYTESSSTALYAANIGGSIPPQNTTIVAHACGGRWVFSYG